MPEHGSHLGDVDVRPGTGGGYAYQRAKLERHERVAIRQLG
ncbi:MAG: hypothetical protein ACRED0_03305 [Gammaproteobacteria bacterium]